MTAVTAPTQTPTAPLPAVAVKAMARLESAFPAVVAEQYRIERVATGLHAGESSVINGTRVTAVSLAVAEAVTRYEVAAARRAQIEAKPTRQWSAADFDAWVGSERTLIDSLTTLAAEGQQHLISAPVDPVIRAAVDLRLAMARVANLSAGGPGLLMTDLEADSFAAAEDIIDAARAMLVDAGRRDLIGGE